MERHERSAFSAPVAGKEVRASFDGGRLTATIRLALIKVVGRVTELASRITRAAVRLSLPGQPHAPSRPGCEAP